MDDYIIRDSSIWENNSSTSILYSKDNAIKIGTVREEIFLIDSGETRYKVEVWDNGRIIPLSCIRTSRFGGIYNYEEYTHRGFAVNDSEASTVRSLQPGDHVVVACLNGSGREGVILGSVPHTGRKEVLNSPDQKAPNKFSEFANKAGPTTVRYVSEFNGVETVINSLGEHRVTFKGQPTNIAKLDEAPTGADIPAPTYDTKVGSSYWEFDKTGSWFSTDNAQDGKQSIKINKADGKIEIISGKTSLVINKKDETYTYTQKKVTYNTADEWNLNTKKTNIKSSAEINATAGKINTEGKWTQKGNVDINGNLTNTGTAFLAGGSYPLIYDIALTIGVGNLGAPVISSHVFLKTAKTKAT